MKKTMIAFLVTAFALAVAGPALAQNVEAKTLRKEIVKLKYVRAQDIQNLLYAYVSREGHIQHNPNMPSILSVSDTPENVEKILAAIREIDVKPADVLYTVQLVLGSEADATTDPGLKNDPIVKELGGFLRYKGYTLLDATLLRTVNRDNAEVNFGPKAEFELALRPEVAGDGKAPVIKTQVRLRQSVVKTIMHKKDDGTEGGGLTNTNFVTLIESTLNVKSGDRTVVGVSKLDGGDKGLILIISAKIVD
ncbi:MAG: hypothetical protein MUE80_06890 [Acidobacteria bacterium]|jgi:hypothetical protein|nr:hypothetical protein [Acidobacteriota bacterium]